MLWGDTMIAIASSANPADIIQRTLLMCPPFPVRRARVATANTKHTNPIGTRDAGSNTSAARGWKRSSHAQKVAETATRALSRTSSTRECRNPSNVGTAQATSGTPTSTTTR